MGVFEKAKWIWATNDVCPDQYTEYIEKAPYVDGKAEFYISADSDYTLFINGKYVASNQYGDFEHYKIYDTIDITPYLEKGDNTLRILAYYCGVNTQRYRVGKAGVIYEAFCNGEVIAKSDENTMSCVDSAYVSGRRRFVSSQLGFTFKYDSRKEGENVHSPSALVDKTVTFYPRPIKKQSVLERKPIEEIIKLSDTDIIIDLGSETVGLATLDIVSDAEQNITVAYGEHLADGFVRKIIGDRSFFFEYVAKVGENKFTDYMLRLGCRYMEIISEQPIEINYVGILPQIYEVEALPFHLEDPLDRRIYRMCINTLRLCMMEHYVDTPWREQGLYAFDSRNQILCGYNVFKGGNLDYVRSNLRLLTEDRRDDGLLSICAPCGTKLAIPSFSLYYIIELNEYLEHSSDTEFIKRCIPKAEGILNEFLLRKKDGLIHRFSDDNMWNFYDWSPYLDGYGEANGVDPVINCLYVLAYNAYENMCIKTGALQSVPDFRREIRRSVRDTFYCKNRLLTFTRGKEEYTTLANAMAVLADIYTNEEALCICDKMIRGETTPSSLSMNIWKYDAMLYAGRGKYREYILEEIRKNYGKMAEYGSDTVWETAVGESDFDKAGSLCHGWSAVPIYIYNRLRMVKQTLERKRQWKNALTQKSAVDVSFKTSRTVSSLE